MTNTLSITNTGWDQIYQSYGRRVTAFYQVGWPNMWHDAPPINVYLPNNPCDWSLPAQPISVRKEHQETKAQEPRTSWISKTSVCRPCLIIMQSCYLDYRINKHIAFSRCMIWVSCSANLTSMFYARKGSGLQNKRLTVSRVEISQLFWPEHYKLLMNVIKKYRKQRFMCVHVDGDTWSTNWILNH